MLGPMQTDETPRSGTYDWSWFPKGMANLFSLPALVLMSAFVGFGGLTRELGIPLEQVIFMIPVIWALPSLLILVAGIASNASLFAVASAVALAAIRMMPMTMALVPEIRTARSRNWHMVVVSNFVAITAWIHTLRVASQIPREGRMPYFVGFASTMMVAVSVVSGVVYQLAATLPPVIMGALYFLTPIYFATSIWATSRVKAEHWALALGFALGPLFYLLFPEFNILIAGFVGGIFAFLGHLWFRRKSRNAKGPAP